MGDKDRAFVVGALLGLSLATPLATRETAGEDTPLRREPLVFRAGVSLVAVPVFVVDGSGKSVAGLTADDFEVYDERERVPIAVFRAIDAGAAATVEEGHEAPLPVQAAAARQFVLLFDALISPPHALGRARDAAARFVRESLQSDDLVAVAVIGGGGLRMLTHFTTDRAYVARAIEGIGRRARAEITRDPLGLGGGPVDSNAGGEVAVGKRAAGADAELAEQLDDVRKHLQQTYAFTAAGYLESIREFVIALSPLSGRKQIVLLSSGLDASSWAVALKGDGADVDARSRMRGLFQAAARADAVIHTVDLAGLEGPVDVASWTGKNENRGRGVDTLAALSNNTGGRRILATNDFGRALREVDQISRHSYVLAFQPAAVATDRRLRRLEVRVRRRGLSVSHRVAYVVPSARTDAGDAAREAIVKGLSGGRLGLALVAVPFRNPDGRLSIPAVLRIDGRSLAAAASGASLALQVYGYAMMDGRAVDSLALDTTLDLSRLGGSVRRDGIHLLTAFAVAPGIVDLRFFVRAGSSAKTGTIRRRVVVPSLAEAVEAVVVGPMLALPPAGKVVIPFQSRDRERLDTPFEIGGEPFVPDAAGILQGGRAREVCAFVRRPSASAPLEASAALTRTGMEPRVVPVEGTPRIVPGADGFERLLVTIVPPALPPGGYSLRLTLRDPATGQVADAETEVVLEAP